MKTYLLSALLFSLLCFISCDFGLTGDEDEDLTELEKLPPLTTTGENTFGCLVNGQVLVVRNTLDIGAIYQGGFLQMGGGSENDEIDQGVFFKLDDPLILRNIYDLSDSVSHYSEYNNRDKKSGAICRYSYDNTYEGSIVFSNIDRANFIVSGTFKFSTVTEGCDTVNITEGRFDVQYTP